VKATIPQSASGFLWSSNSPRSSLGNDFQAAKLLAPMLRDFFSQPRFLARFAFDGLIGASECLVHFDLEHVNVRPQGPDSPVYRRIAAAFPQEDGPYLESLQQRNALGDFTLLNFAQRLLVLLGLTGLLFAGASGIQRASPSGTSLLAVALTGVLANALVCGALSTPTDARYSARVIWLIPFLSAAVCLEAWHARNRATPPA
jgi:hypothetical protein